MPGTTRDWIEEQAVLNGALLRLIDTAGLRHTDDAVEQAGVAMTGERISDADILCHVIDMQAERGIETAIADALNELQTANPSATVIAACNKRDLVDMVLPDKVGGVEIIAVSALTGEGMDRLEASIAHEARRMTRGPEAGRVLVTNSRHADCLRRALDSIGKAIKSLEQGMSNEFIAYEIRGAVDALGEIIGLVSTDDVLNAIFDRFCIGK
jgi:tRNA modification GTPase